MRGVGMSKLGAGATLWALIVTSWIVWAPGAAADALLVDAQAFVSSSTDRGDDDDFDAGGSFDSTFVESVESVAPGERGLARQDTDLTTTDGVLRLVTTQARVESSASGTGTGDRPSDSRGGGGRTELRVDFSISEPTTLWIEGTINSSHGGTLGCSEVSLVIDTERSTANTGACGTQEPEDQRLSERIDLDIAGDHFVSIEGQSFSSGRGAADFSSGSASWDLRVGFCQNEPTDADDLITGTDEDDVLCGGGGNDTIDGGLGADSVFGGPGDDDLSGGPGDDFLDGSLGIDKILGQEDNDEIEGGVGDDSPDEVDQDVRLDGGPGEDSVDGGPGDDLLVQEQADADDDQLRGGPGNDFLSAALDGGNNLLFGQGGRDLVVGGSGNDFLDGGRGDETGTVDGTQILIIGGPGRDTIFGDAGDDLIEGGSGDDVVNGGPGSDKLRGQDGADCLIGGARKDVFVGGPGNDRMLARDGIRDEVHGGPNFDRAQVDNRDDVDGVEDRSLQGNC